MNFSLVGENNSVRAKGLFRRFKFLGIFLENQEPIINRLSRDIRRMYMLENIVNVPIFRSGGPIPLPPVLEPIANLGRGEPRGSS